MSVTRSIVKGVVKPVERAVEFGGSGPPPSGPTIIEFNGTDQYATHSAWTPTGTNFTQSVKYTPYDDAIGSDVTILGDHLTKNASDQLVYSYTDTAAGSQTVTLTAVTLVADTEYTIAIASGGNGITLGTGVDEATNSAIVDPSTLSFETWMRDSGGTDYNHGVVRDIEFTDLSKIQDGDYLNSVSANLSVDVPDIELAGEFDIQMDFVLGSSANTELVGGPSSAGTFFIDGTSGNIRVFAFDSGGSLAFLDSTPMPDVGQHSKIRVIRDGSNNITAQLDGREVFDVGVVSDTFNIRNFFLRTTTTSNPGDLIRLDVNNGEYIYEMNDIVDNTGTGTVPNTGSAGSGFNGTANNYDPGVDLLTVANNSRSYPVDAESETQPDELNPGGGNDATIVNF